VRPLSNEIYVIFIVVKLRAINFGDYAAIGKAATSKQINFDLYKHCPRWTAIEGESMDEFWGI
jgi:hypothetical protein